MKSVSRWVENMTEMEDTENIIGDEKLEITNHINSTISMASFFLLTNTHTPTMLKKFKTFLTFYIIYIYINQL